MFYRLLRYKLMAGLKSLAHLVLTDRSMCIINMFTTKPAPIVP